MTLTLPKVPSDKRRDWFRCRRCGEVFWHFLPTRGHISPPCKHADGIVSISEEQAIIQLRKRYDKILEEK